MKRALSIVAFLIVVFPSISFADAILIDSRGDVRVSIPGQRGIPGKSGLELPNGSTVTVGGAGQASMLLDTGALDQISAGTTYSVGASATTGVKRIDLGPGIALAMREMDAYGEKPVVGGKSKGARGPDKRFRNISSKIGGSGISAIYPRGTSIELAHDVIFRWTGDNPVDWASPAIVIDDANQNHIAVIPIAKGSTEKAVGVGSAGLEKGQNYSWYLAMAQPKVTGKTMRFKFSTLSDVMAKKLSDEIAKISSLGLGKDGCDIIKGQALYQAGLYGRMVDLLEPLYTKNNSPFIKKLLHMGYTKMGQAEKAYTTRHGAK